MSHVNPTQVLMCAIPDSPSYISFICAICHLHMCDMSHSYVRCSNTLQHTATHCHCNTLQHTATHCNSHSYVRYVTFICALQQHTATHCNTLQLQHTATHCNTLQLTFICAICHQHVTFICAVCVNVCEMRHDSLICDMIRKCVT